MLVPYSWLREYVDCDPGAEELARLLTAAGVTVDRVSVIGHVVRGAVVARIAGHEPHPGADRSRVVTIDAGGREYRMVSGAPNIHTGDLVVAALPGARLGDREIESVSVRGVESDGMLCSARELGLFDDRPEREAGILVLGPGARPGTDAAAYLGLGDEVLELDLTPNRGDCLSITGVAREVAAVTGCALTLPGAATGEEGPLPVPIRIADPLDCPRYGARILADVTVGPGTDWMGLRLRAAGMRPINNLVDITNYVMLELGQPLHAFDLDRLVGPRIEVRRARRGERLVTLDQVSRELDPDMLVIADDSGPVALAGIMGGLDSEVYADTVNVLLESANFEPRIVRRTARRLGLSSAASTRFERNADPEQVLPALDRVVELAEQIGCGRGLPAVSDQCPGRKELDTIVVRPERVTGLLGVELEPAHMADYLNRAGLDTRVSEGRLHVQLTSRRPDVSIEVDCIEEIGRLHGYDHIPATLPTGPVAGCRSERLDRLGRLRSQLIAGGWCEIISYSFISPGVWDRLQLPGDHPWRGAIPIKNPLSGDRSIMRTTLVPGMIQTLARNAGRQATGMMALEIGNRFIPNHLPLTDLPAEVLTLCLGAMGEPGGRQWYGPPVPGDLYLVTGALGQVCEARGLDLTLIPITHELLHPGRAASVVIDGRRVGIAGELHPRLIEEFRLPGPVAVCEIDVEPLLTAADSVRDYHPLPRFPGSNRDLAVVVADSARAGDVLTTIRDHGTDLLTGVNLFDAYRGEGIAPGHRSLAFSLWFNHPERTLTDDDVSAAIARIQQALAREHGARVRD